MRALQGAEALKLVLDLRSTHACDMVFFVLKMCSLQRRMLVESLLEARWMNCMSSLGVARGMGILYRDIERRYSESHRAYHTFEHISQCFSAYDAAAHIVTDPVMVELAIWYHDIIYHTSVPRMHENEDRSAAYARRTLRFVIKSNEVLEGIAALILATKHIGVPMPGDAALMVDIDLSILGQSSEEFDAYEAKVRREYASMHDAEFFAGRRRILEGFLARRRIYTTNLFYNLYELTARANLARSISRLENVA